MDETLSENGSLISQVSALLSGQTDLIANAANLSSLLFHALEDGNCGHIPAFDRVIFPARQTQ